MTIDQLFADIDRLKKEFGLTGASAVTVDLPTGQHLVRVLGVTGEPYQRRNPR